jgi:hypothetical protein
MAAIAPAAPPARSATDSPCTCAFFLTRWKNSSPSTVSSAPSARGGRLSPVSLLCLLLLLRARHANLTVPSSSFTASVSATNTNTNSSKSTEVARNPSQQVEVGQQRRPSSVGGCCNVYSPSTGPRDTSCLSLLLLLALRPLTPRGRGAAGRRSMSVRVMTVQINAAGEEEEVITTKMTRVEEDGGANPVQAQ